MIGFNEGFEEECEGGDEGVENPAWHVAIGSERQVVRVLTGCEVEGGLKSAWMHVDIRIGEEQPFPASGLSANMQGMAFPQPFVREYFDADGLQCVGEFLFEAKQDTRG